MFFVHNTCFYLLFQDVWWDKRSPANKTIFYVQQTAKESQLLSLHRILALQTTHIGCPLFDCTATVGVSLVKHTSPLQVTKNKDSLSPRANFIPADLLASEVQKLSDKRRGQTQQLQFLGAKAGHRAVLVPDSELVSDFMYMYSLFPWEAEWLQLASQLRRALFDTRGAQQT